MFKEDFEDDTLLVGCLEEVGVDNWDGYDEAYELYESRKEEQIKKINERIDKVNKILDAASTPQKKTMLLIGVASMVADIDWFIGKALLNLDDESLDHLLKDLVPEERGE